MTNEIKLSGSIMAHTSRQDRIPWLLSRLRGLQGLRLALDDGRLGVARNAERAWKMDTAGSTHHLVIQDDALPCDHFAETAINAIRAVPDAPVCFYCAYANAVKKARKHKSPWVKVPNGTWTVALSMPVGMVAEAYRWIGEHCVADLKHDDTALAMWALLTGTVVWCTMPSLVDHDNRMKSTLGHSNYRSGARWMVTQGVDPRDFIWDIPRSMVPTHPVSPRSVIRNHPYCRKTLRDPEAWEAKLEAGWKPGEE